MSKMALHEPFGHLQHKLWAKEGLGVNLTIWLLTTKSRELTQPRCVQVATHYWKAFKESYKFASNLIIIGGLSKELWPCKVLEIQTETLLGPTLGVSRQKAIRVWVPRSNTENTIWGKVVASLESGPRWVLWVQSCPWFVLALKVL